MYSFEQLVKEYCYWEDPDTSLIIISRDENGGFVIFDNEWRRLGEGETLDEAAEIAKQKIKRYFKC